MTKSYTNNDNDRSIFSAKVVLFDIQNSNGVFVTLNAEQASKYGIKNNDKISIIRRNEEFVVDVTLTDKYIQANEIGVTKDFLESHPIVEGDTVLISFVQNNPLSLQAIRKKLFGKKISNEEIDAIVEDIMNNKLSDLQLAYFVSTSFFYKSDVNELAYMTKATAYTGDIYRFPGIVAGKYCIGGVPGNETTMIVIPILASLGLTAPKTFSKAITSPAATGECVNVLMDIEFSKQEIIRITDKVGACLVWNEKLNLAPANDRIIKVSSPLGIEPYARMISSIMAKNYAMGINHCLIDIPMGPTAKVANLKDAKRVAKHFKEIGEYLGIKMDVQITDALEPIGRGVGASLQAREALRILQQHEERSKDLEDKAIFLASRILLLCNAASSIENAEKLVKAQLKNGEARKKMQEIISAQNGNPHIKSEDIQLGEFKFNVCANEDCIIDKVDMKYLNMMVRGLGAPKEYKAGIYLHKKLGDTIKAGEPIYTMYSPSESKLGLVKQMLTEKDFYTYKSISSKEEDRDSKISLSDDTKKTSKKIIKKDNNISNSKLKNSIQKKQIIKSKSK